MTGKHRTVRRQLFPEKLWDLVNKPESGIQWSPDGKRIEVERSQLEKFIGTKFRSHNFDSFIRQLHFYGFRKSGNSYHHDKFQRGQPDALLTMKRKYSNLTISSLSPCSTSNSSSNYSSNSDGSKHQAPQTAGRAEHIEPGEELTLYTLEQDKTACSLSSFVRKDLAKADRDENSIKITLPDVLKDASRDAWPKTLVLENHWVGNQNILSAYFIYRTQELN